MDANQLHILTPTITESQKVVDAAHGSVRIPANAIAESLSNLVPIENCNPYREKNG